MYYAYASMSSCRSIRKINTTLSGVQHAVETVTVTRAMLLLLLTRAQFKPRESSTVENATDASCELHPAELLIAVFRRF